MFDWHWHEPMPEHGRSLQPRRHGWDDAAVPRARAHASASATTNDDVEFDLEFRRADAADAHAPRAALQPRDARRSTGSRARATCVCTETTSTSTASRCATGHGGSARPAGNPSSATATRPRARTAASSRSPSTAAVTTASCAATSCVTASGRTSSRDAAPSSVTRRVGRRRCASTPSTSWGVSLEAHGTTVSRQVFTAYPDMFCWNSLARWEYDGQVAWGEDQDIWHPRKWRDFAPADRRDDPVSDAERLDRAGSARDRRRRRARRAPHGRRVARGLHGRRARWADGAVHALWLRADSGAGPQSRHPLLPAPRGGGLPSARRHAVPRGRGSSPCTPTRDAFLLERIEGDGRFAAITDPARAGRGRDVVHGAARAAPRGSTPRARPPRARARPPPSPTTCTPSSTSGKRSTARTTSRSHCSCSRSRGCANECPPTAIGRWSSCRATPARATSCTPATRSPRSPTGSSRTGATSTTTSAGSACATPRSSSRTSPSASATTSGGRPPHRPRSASVLPRARADPLRDRYPAGSARRDHRAEMAAHLIFNTLHQRLLAEALADAAGVLSS